MRFHARSTVRILRAAMALALAYALTGALARWLAVPPGYAMIVYPPAGLALAVVACFGMQLLPGVFLGSLTVNLLIAAHVSTSMRWEHLAAALLIASGASAQAMAGAALLRRISPDLTCTRPADLYRFVLYPTLLTCLISASIGVGSLAALDLLPPGSLWSNGLTWWGGDSLGVLCTTPIVLSILAPHPLWRTRRRNVMLPMLVCLVVVISSFVVIRQRENSKHLTELHYHTQRLAQGLQTALDRHELAVRQIERFFASSVFVTREEFSRFVTHMLASHPAMASLSWAPQLSAGQRAEYEAQMQVLHFPNFTIRERNAEGALVPAGTRSTYYPVTYLEPLGQNLNVLGYDMGSESRRLAAMEDARDSGNLTASDPLTLINGTQTSDSVLLFAPLYRQDLPQATLAQRQTAFSGVAISVLHMHTLVGHLLQQQGLHTLELRFYDLSYPAGKGIFFNTLEEPDLNYLSQATLSFGGRQYALLAQPSAAYWQEHVSWLTWMTLLGGLLFSSLFGVYLLAGSAHTYTVETLVKARTAQLHEREHKLDTILENAAEGILTTNLSGRIESVNKAAERLFATPAERLRGRMLDTLFPDPSARNILQEALQPGAPATTRIELQGISHQGEVLPLEMALTRIDGADNPMLIVLLHDLSERRRSERLKSEFVSAVSHELRTPLTSIRGALGLLSGGAAGALSEQAGALVRMAHDNAVRLTSLINDLLDFEKLEYGALRFVMRDQALIPLIEQAILDIQGYAQSCAIRLQWQAPEGFSPQVCVDEHRLLQVLSNLLSNAIKFSHESGVVRVHLKQHAGAARIEIQDDGIGISSEFHSSIFGKFTQEDARTARKYPGTGLGLSLSKTLIEKMSGRIGFSSVEGQGSTFYIDLPLITSAAPSQTRESTE